MKLEVHERLVILDLLPKEEDIAGMKAIRRAREMLGFTPEEEKTYNLRIDNGQWKWDTQQAAQIVKDIPLDEYITNKIRDALALLNKDHKLRNEFMSLYDKFITMYQ